MVRNVQSEEFWDPKDLRAELLRVVEVCHGCRLCSDLCPAFRRLLTAIDGAHGGWVSALTEGETRGVADLCYQCKLCAIRCPYTSERGHPLDVDFPRLMLREKLVRVRRDGLPLGRRLLANPELTGAVGVLTAPMSNWVGKIGWVRRAMEGFFEVDRRCRIPPFHRGTFERWFRKRERRLRKRVKGANGKVALFYTCSVNYHRPSIGQSTVALLAHHDVEVVCPEQRCCGMPYLREGLLAGALLNLEFNVRAMRRFAERGYTIVALQPTCGTMLKKEYPWLDDGEPTRAVSEATMDLSEYLMSLHGKHVLDGKFVRSPGRVLYHVPCHLRAQGIGDESKDALNLIPGIEIEEVDGCAGLGGTWGLRKADYETSVEVARLLFDRIGKHQPDRIVSDCAFAGLRIQEGLGRKVLHPVEVLHYAYGLSLDV